MIVSKDVSLLELLGVGVKFIAGLLFGSGSGMLRSFFEIALETQSDI